MDELRAGIIGLGVGEKHIAAFNAHPNCKVTALCDFSKKKLDGLGKFFPNARCTGTASDVIDDPDIDIVSVASFDNYHFEHVSRAIQNGKHVFVEKPLCLQYHEAVEIRRLLSDNPDNKLSSNFSLRTCPRFVRVREAILSGEMGVIYYIEGDYLWGRINKLTEGWRKDMEFYSIIHGAAVHMIDLVLWITDMRPVEIQALGNKMATAGSGMKFNSFAVILMKFEDGSIAKISANGGCIHPHFHRLTVFGRKKTFIHDLLGSKWIDVTDPDVEKRDVVEDYPAKEKRGEVITSFVNSILSKGSMALIPCDDVFNTTSVCFAAEKAISSGRPIEVDYI
jgi:predicted dehydrogenase